MNKKRVLIVLTIFLILSLGGFILFKESDFAKVAKWDQQIFEKMENPKAREVAESLPKDKLQFAVSRGFRRVELDTLKLWNKERLALAEASKKVCAGFWTGNMEASDFLAALESLKSEQQEAWVEVSARTLEAEILGAEIFELSEKEIRLGFKTFFSSLEEEEQRGKEVFAKNTYAEDEEACWIMKRIMNFAQNESEGARALLKYLAHTTAMAGVDRSDHAL